MISLEIMSRDREHRPWRGHPGCRGPLGVRPQGLLESTASGWFGSSLSDLKGCFQTMIQDSREGLGMSGEKWKFSKDKFSYIWFAHLHFMLMYF